MKIEARPYRDSRDLTPMRQLLMAGAQAKIAASYMHPGCFDWALHCPPDEQANRRNLRLWERVDGESPALAAWAMFWPAECSFDLFVQPALHGAAQHEAIMDDYVAWAEARAREAGLRQLWPFWVIDYDQVMARLLQARGFVLVQADPAPPLMEYVLDTLPAPPLPEGFRVQAVNNPDDGRLRAQVSYAAFGSGDSWERYWEHYARFMASAVYAGERDLFVRAPDGRGASACTLWFDSVNGVGLFEPVATHPDFQGQGLGKAVMAEGLRRMQAAGMRRAVLGFNPDNVAARALYTSLGFRPACYFTMAHKQI